MNTIKILLLFIIVLFCSCNTEIPKEIDFNGIPVRLSAHPDNVWLIQVHETKKIQVEIVANTEIRTKVKPTINVVNPSIVSCKWSSKGVLEILARSTGQTDVNLDFECSEGKFHKNIRVSVGSDVLVLGGFNSVPMYEFNSLTGNFKQTSLILGGSDGVSDFFIHQNKLYVLENDKIIGDMLRIFDIYDYKLLKTFYFGDLRYAQRVLPISAEKAVLISQLPDSNNVDNVQIFNLTTGIIEQTIVLPNNIGYDLWLADAVISNDRLFITTTPFDAGLWAFRQCYVIVVDLTNFSVVDVDLSTPELDFIPLTYKNPRKMHLEDDGDLVVVCAGDGMAIPPEDGAVIVLDTRSFEIKKTITLGSAGYAGAKMVLDKDMRLYLPDQYSPYLHSFDTKNDVLLRDHSKAVFFTPQAIGFTGAGISRNNLILSNPYGYQLQVLDISQDDNVTKPKYHSFEQYNVFFSHLAVRQNYQEPIFCDKVMNPANLPVGADATKICGHPEGAGVWAESADVVELGADEIILSFDEHKIVNGAGADFMIFTAATYETTGKPADFDASCWLNICPARVWVSNDNKTWVEFSVTENPLFDIHDPRRWVGSWAGINPTIANTSNNYFLDFASSGGDRFDLALVGLDEAKYIKIKGKGCKIDAIVALNYISD